MTREQNIFGAKYGNKENTAKKKKKAEWINNMEKELEETEEVSKAKIHLNSTPHLDSIFNNGYLQEIYNSLISIGLFLEK